MTAINTHAHVFTRELQPVAQARYRPDYDALLGEWLALQQASGVTHGVLVQPSFLGSDNAYLLDALAAAPGRLRGVAVTDAGVSAATLNAWDARGVRGIRLNLQGRADLSAYALPEWQDLFRAVADLGWHLELYCEGERFPALLQALRACPATLVFDHFGAPAPHCGADCAGVQAILARAARSPVYVKLSGPYRLRGEDPVVWADFWLSRLGAQRLMWGSDWPWTNHENRCSYAQSRAWLDDWTPDAAGRRQILWDTPAALFGFSG
jgi:predicted TIM-barrel fold metal-dependent hydrolase